MEQKFQEIVNRGLERITQELTQLGLSEPENIRDHLIDEIAKRAPSYRPVLNLTAALKRIEDPSLIEELKVSLARIRYYGGASGALSQLATRYCSRQFQ
ncbi:hypothetical protein HYT58_02465 [Candidatus Woesearchaeota archaeon]|nr:hypothetical protein [Candidatus Woesearchaeota archaeon]